MSGLAIAHVMSAGTTLAALSYGLPLVLVPQGADQFEIADACVAAGVERAIMPPELSSTAVRDSVATVLDESAEQAAARGVQAGILAMPDAEDAALHLTELIGARLS